MKRFALGLALVAVWFAVGFAVARAVFGIIEVAVFWGDGGKTWKIARDFGVIALPFLLVFGGVPAAIQIWRGRPYRTAIVASLFICLLSTVVVVSIVP
jgi:hypothetical protein